ncbi:MAG: ATP-dependent metallopeptidase FtsH/Yme1/Tma family protein, partial [Desulfobacterales bacterium]
MQNQNRFRTLIIIGGIWLTFLLFNFLSTNAAVKTIPYSEFLQLAKEGRVSEVAVSDNVIQGKMFTENAVSEQGELFQTVRVDAEISDVLEQNGIEYAGKIQSDFISNLFSWIFPVLLFLGLWFLIMRRFQKQQGGFMTLGKNKAKIYMENDVEVRFE